MHARVVLGVGKVSCLERRFQGRAVPLYQYLNFYTYVKLFIPKTVFL